MLKFVQSKRDAGIWSAPSYVVANDGDGAKPWGAYFHGYLDLGHYKTKEDAIARCELHAKRGT